MVTKRRAISYIAFILGLIVMIISLNQGGFQVCMQTNPPTGYGGCSINYVTVFVFLVGVVLMLIGLLLLHIKKH